MNPTPVAHVKAVADAGEVMPQKSTFFYPKLASGLVINPIVPSEEVWRTTSSRAIRSCAGGSRLWQPRARLSLLDRSAAARRLRAPPYGRVVDFCCRLRRRRARPLDARRGGARRRWSSCSRGWRTLARRNADDNGMGARVAVVEGDLRARAARRRRQPSTSPSPIRRIARSTKGRRRPTTRWRSRSTSSR